MSVECFGQRLLNPYRGTMHTIRFEAAEAVTVDGVNWDIYVANDSLLEGLDAAQHPQITDIRFGAWSAAQGLRRGPIYPSEDFLRMERMGAIVYQYLTQVHRRVPFPLRDHFEFWLLDVEGMPLALLHSVVDERDMNLEVGLEWRPGFAAREKFVSTAVPEGVRCAADHLGHHVNARAGERPAGQWFRREKDGSGTGLAANRDGLAGRRLPKAAFPTLLLAVDWMDAPLRRLADDFHAWQAPFLLALHDLPRTLRAELERAARNQATLVERHHRLYPETVDPMTINAALVEAVLCRTQVTLERPDPALSTFYIELNQNPPDWERGR
jgi:hypothetical protein